MTMRHQDVADVGRLPADRSDGLHDLRGAVRDARVDQGQAVPRVQEVGVYELDLHPPEAGYNWLRVHRACLDPMNRPAGMPPRFYRIGWWGGNSGDWRSIGGGPVCCGEDRFTRSPLRETTATRRVLAQDRQIAPMPILGTTSEKSTNHPCSFIKNLVILHTGWF